MTVQIWFYFSERARLAFLYVSIYFIYLNNLSMNYNLYGCAFKCLSVSIVANFVNILTIYLFHILISTFSYLKFQFSN